MLDIKNLTTNLSEFYVKYMQSLFFSEIMFTLEINLKVKTIYITIFLIQPIIYIFEQKLKLI
jgi:hypothetical protein